MITTRTITHTIAAIAATIAAAGAAHAQAYGTGKPAQTEYAVSITPSFTSSTRTECSATPAAPTGGGWLGQALGGIIGAGVGSQIGSGSGQSAAAAAGAVLGAQAGAAMSNGSTQPAQTCRDVTERTLIGYTLRAVTGREIFVPLALVQAFNSGR